MRVLLVDDEQELLEQAKIFLKKNKENIKIDTVISPDSALAKIDIKIYDVIVSDYQMPKMDGLEFLRIIREEKELDVPFIMFTGKGRENVAMEALNLGADRYFQKGGDPKSQYGVLAEAISQEVEHYQTRKNLENRKKLFERAVQHAPYPAMLQAEDREVLLVNNIWTEITGYEEDDIDHISDWTEKAYGEKKDLVESEIETLFDKEDRVNEGVYTVTTKSGNERKWDFSTSPLGKLPDGRRLILSMANDITDRKETEDALRESEKKYQAITEKSHDAIFVTDEDKILFANDSTSELTGYCKEELLDKNWLELLHPEDREKILKIDRQGRKGEEVPTRYEARILTKEGDVRYGDFRVAPIEYEGKLAILGTIRDITEQKEKEDELEKAKQEWENIFQAIGHPTLILDNEHNILHANKAALELSDLDIEEMRKKKCYEIFHESDTSPEDCPVRKLIESEEVEIADMKMELVMGEYMVSVTPVFNKEGDIEKIIHIATDITERKEKEKELQKERNFLEQIAEMSPVCIIELNAEGEIIYANDRAEDVLGLSKSKIKGRTYNDVKWNIKGPDGNDFPDEKLPFNQVKDKSEPVYGVKHAIEWPDGEWKLLSINASPIYDENGDFDGMVASIENITEKEEKERKLKESRRRLKTLMDNIPGMAYRCKNNRNWTMRFISEGCVELTGYEPEELIDDKVLSYMDVIHPDDREYVWNEIQNSVKEGESFKLEYRILTSSGETRWVWEKGKKIKTDGEEFLEGIITDITERKKTEEKLKESEGKYRSLFYETPLGTIYYDKDGVIKECNKKFVDIIGSSKEKLIGFDMLERLEDDELREQVKASLTEGRGHYEGEYESVTADKTIPVRIRFKGIKNENGDIYAGIGLIEDITEQKEKEKEVEKEKEKYESLFEENPEAIVEVDEDFNIVKVNSRFGDLFKYREDEILGSHLDDLVVPKGRKKEAEELNHRSKDEGYFEHETIRRDKYGNEVHVSITGRPIKQEGKTHHIAVYRDISERKEAEKRGGFLHSLLRHDVRNKAQLAQGYLELLEESCENDLQHDYLNKASRSIKEAEEIINKVSKLRKIENEEEVKKVDLSSVFDKVLSELEDQLEYEDIDLQVEECGYTVEGGVLLEELFYNLIENSIKHSNCSRIEIKTYLDENECMVSIEDDGKGIPNRYKEKVFEKGFKKGKTAGSGLGMYMVKEIAENYGGDVDVLDSDLGGVRFDVQLKKGR
ncbi:MAG: PAS domain S-box protein [Thermoplasmata archaeon]